MYPPRLPGGVVGVASEPGLVRYTATGDAMAYVSAAKGFKSGGFNPSSVQPGRGFAPEWAWSYEAGVKTTFLHGRARMNVAAFDMRYTNLQVQTPIVIGVFDIRNAAAATIRGIEVESAMRLRVPYTLAPPSRREARFTVSPMTV